MNSPDAETNQRWWQGLDRYCWIVLLLAALGWLFDTMDQNLYNLVRQPSVRELMRPLVTDPRLQNAEEKAKLDPDLRVKLEAEAKTKLDKAAKEKGGVVQLFFLLGWSAGGFFFGIIGDKIGRVRTMVATILIYATFTGLSGFVHSWQMYSVARFLTGFGVGGEWAAGASLVAEVFPRRSRPMALGLLQALSAFGNMAACGITMVIGDLDLRWRWAYFVGALPALLVIWIMRSIKEPERWQHAKEQAALGKELGKMSELFTNPTLRRNTTAAVLMVTAGVIGLWGIAFFSTDMMRSELKRETVQKSGMEGQTKGFIQQFEAKWFGEKTDDPKAASKAVDRKVGFLFMIQQLGAFFGIYLFAVFAQRFGRKPAFYLAFVLAWVMVLVFAWSIDGSGHNAFARALILCPLLGFGTVGPFSGYTIYFPELFPTRLRATGCGFCYNAARILAAFGSLILGGFAAKLATYDASGAVIHSGYAPAATLISFIYILGFIGAALGPETKDQPLPE